jgi:hypothetical protein
MLLRVEEEIPRFARNRLRNPTESLRGAKRRSNLIELKEIATLPSVARNDRVIATLPSVARNDRVIAAHSSGARNDNAMAFNAFVLIFLIDSIS